MATFQLLNGELATVDDQDLPLVETHTWHLHSNGYVIRTTGTQFERTVHWLHRIIAGTPDGMVTDHIDGNKLNNCRSNLRVVTSAKNSFNRQISKCESKTSQFKGVNWHKSNKKWRAVIKSIEDRITKQRHLGYFSNELEATKAYNKAAIMLFGEFAKLNPV